MQKKKHSLMNSSLDLGHKAFCCFFGHTTSARDNLVAENEIKKQV